MNRLLRNALLSGVLLSLNPPVDAQRTTDPSLSVEAPRTALVGDTITPSATAIAGTFPLAGMQMSYSWDDGVGGWTELAATGTPNGPSCVLSHPIRLGRAGILHIKADCWDVYSTEANAHAIDVQVVAAAPK